MSQSDSTRTAMDYHQKEADSVLAPAPLPNGKEVARRAEHDGHGDLLTHKVIAQTVVSDGEICVKIKATENGRFPGAFANGAVLTYHQWAQSGYTPESHLDHCPDCGKVCSSEFWNDDAPGCVFCNHPDL